MIDPKVLVPTKENEDGTLGLTLPENAGALIIVPDTTEGFLFLGVFNVSEGKKTFLPPLLRALIYIAVNDEEALARADAALHAQDIGEASANQDLLKDLDTKGNA